MAEHDDTWPLDSESEELTDELRDAEQNFADAPTPANLQERTYFVELLRAYRREQDRKHREMGRRVSHLEQVVEGIPAKFEATLRAHAEDEMSVIEKLEGQLAGQRASLERLGNIVAMNNDHVQEIRAQHHTEHETTRKILAKLKILDVISTALRIGGDDLK